MRACPAIVAVASSLAVSVGLAPSARRVPAASGSVHAQEPSSVARDVPYVATRDAVVEAMLDLARVRPDDVVIDLGSGDGRIVIAAARDRGARGIGVEIDPALVAFSRRAAADAGVADRVEFRVGNLFDADLSEATVVAIFLGADENLALRPRLLDELEPGDRVVSNTFTMGEWRPDRSLEIATLPVAFFVYVWEIPARVEGRWEWSTTVTGRPRRYVARVRQRFQELEVRVTRDGLPVTVREATLSGARIVLEIVDGRGPEGDGAALMRYEGRVGEHGTIDGTARISLGDEVVSAPWAPRRLRP